MCYDWSSNAGTTTIRFPARQHLFHVDPAQTVHGPPPGPPPPRGRGIRTTGSAAAPATSSSPPTCTTNWTRNSRGAVAPPAVGRRVCAVRRRRCVAIGRAIRSTGAAIRERYPQSVRRLSAKTRKKTAVPAFETSDL
ncbi:unnamed protein product [Callosobruchus maculatus]|uniref:Uncharacterized protein n=1 Tax=Callosobruchus maculatus TaxID=64391 RepID=A0A653D3S9_CALMS|nr:unnamed protein product [Callosobruchus maculatus]